MKKKVFDILFDSEDYIVYGNKFCRNSVDICDYTVAGKPYTHWSTQGKVMSLHKTSYLLLNPVKKNTTRKKENISKFRSFLIESDCIPLATQMKVLLYALKYHNLPIGYIVFSGGKSYHCIVTLEDPISHDNTYLKQNADFLNFDKSYRTPSEVFSNIHQRLIKKMNSIVLEMMGLPKEHKSYLEKIKPNKLDSYFDYANKDVTRLSRFPGAESVERKRGQQQIILAKERVSKKDFLAFLRTCPAVPFYNPPKEEDLGFFTGPDRIYKKDSFIDKCSSRLRSKINFLQENADDAEMHQTIRSFFLALFEEFKNLTEEEALEIAEDYIFPFLLEVGYERTKLYQNTTISWCYEKVRNVH